MKNKAIGIIGGMGPEASEKFYGLLIKHAQKDYKVEKNEDFPEIYLASIPVPDFISDQKQQAQAEKILINRIKIMDNLPIGFYCMACNTGHLLLDQLNRITKKPFISMLEELPKYIKAKRYKRVGLLASPTTIKSKMYKTVLKNAGIELVLPDKEDINTLGKIIKEIVAGNKLENNSIIIQQIAKRLIDRGSQGIIEGCTEIPLIFPKQNIIPIFDSMEILALAVLKKYYSVKIKERVPSL